MKLLFFYSIPLIIYSKLILHGVSKVVGPQSCFNRVTITILAALFLSRFHLLGKMHGDLKIRDVQELNSSPGRAFDPGLSNS